MTDPNIIVNYKRLNRHYDLILKQFDEIALYDLAHSLRMWVDMKESVADFLKLYPPKQKFKSYTVTKQLNRIVGRREYIIAGLPNGVKHGVETPI